MEEIIKALKSVSAKCLELLDINIWFAIAGAVLALWTIIKLAKISRLNKSDSSVMSLLIANQKAAVLENYSPELRQYKHIEILKSKKNYILWLYYKYVISHKDFSNIMTAFTFREYRQVAPRRRVRLFGSFLLVFLTILAVAVISFYKEADFQLGLIKPDTGFGGLMIPAVIFAAFIFLTLILCLYRRNVKATKESLFADMRESSTKFFSPIEPNFEQFKQAILGIANIPEKRKERIKSQLKNKAQSDSKPMAETKKEAPQKEIVASTAPSTASENTQKQVEPAEIFMDETSADTDDIIIEEHAAKNESDEESVKTEEIITSEMAAPEATEQPETKEDSIFEEEPISVFEPAPVAAPAPAPMSYAEPVFESVENTAPIFEPTPSPSQTSAPITAPQSSAYAEPVFETVENTAPAFASTQVPAPAPVETPAPAPTPAPSPTPAPAPSLVINSSPNYKDRVEYQSAVLSDSAAISADKIINEIKEIEHAKQEVREQLNSVPNIDGKPAPEKQSEPKFEIEIEPEIEKEIKDRRVIRVTGALPEETLSITEILPQPKVAPLNPELPNGSMSAMVDEIVNRIRAELKASQQEEENRKQKMEAIKHLTAPDLTMPAPLPEPKPKPEPKIETKPEPKPFSPPKPEPKPEPVLQTALAQEIEQEIIAQPEQKPKQAPKTASKPKPEPNAEEADEQQPEAEEKAEKPKTPRPRTTSTTAKPRATSTTPRKPRTTTPRASSANAATGGVYRGISGSKLKNLTPKT